MDNVSVDDVVVLMVPRSIKGRWVRASREAGGKLIPWLIEKVEAGNTTNPKPLSAFALDPNSPDEPLATVAINCTKEQKTRWQKQAHSDGFNTHERRLTEWIANRVESTL